MKIKYVYNIITGRAKTLFGVLVLSGLLQLAVIPGVEAADTVRVGLYENKPLVFMDDNGRAKGIFIDILEYIAAKEKWDLEYIYGSWPECLDRLESGEIDLMTAIAFSKERAKKYNYTYETVITNWGQVFVPKGSKINSILDLDKKKIAVKMEDIHFYGIRELTSKFNMECRFIESDGYDVVFELIEVDRVHAGVVNRIFGLQNKDKYPVQETPMMFNPIEVRYAAPKHSDTDLLSTIDIHLNRMYTEKDPFYDKTLNRWLVAPSKWVLPDSIKYTFIGIGLLLVVFAVTNITLRFRIKKRTNELSFANVKLKSEVQIRMKAEEELRKYERIVASSTDHMSMIDLSYSYQAINEAALHAINKSREEVIGEKTWDILGEVLPGKTHKQRLDRVFSGQIVKYRAWMEFPNLGRRFMDIVYTPYALSGKGISGCVVNSRDITDRYELEKKLENAQKMEFMGTIAGGVAHDLNNILSGIVSYPELLLMQIEENSPLEKPIQTIKKSGEKAAVIVQDLLTLARRGVANKEPVNLNEIIHAFLNSPECNKIKSFHANVSISTNLTDQLKIISGSTVHLSKTIMNLVSNAAEAMPNGGTINILTKNTDLNDVTIRDAEVVSGEYILLEISDNGSGISEEDINRIFEPFYTKKIMGRSGTGLGLAVVWGTVMDHAGHIEVKSDGHYGSTFKLYFPVSLDDVQPQTQKPEAIKYLGNGEKVLIVDDVEDQREIASGILSVLGYTVTAVASGEEAIEFLKNKSVDLVILDMIMPPGIDGLATYEQILEIQPGQKAIIASGFAETERVKRALDLGVGQFIKKPYSIGDVGFAIKKELTR
jgi:two-component system cell cycle sensor histidine kinase/response regulator CckA